MSWFLLMLMVLLVTAGFRRWSRAPRARWVHRTFVLAFLLLPFPGLAPRIFLSDAKVEHLLIVDISRSMVLRPAVLVDDALRAFEDRVGDAEPIVIAAGSSARWLIPTADPSETAGLNGRSLRRSCDIEAALATGLSKISGDGPLHISVYSDMGLEHSRVLEAGSLLAGRQVDAVVVLEPDTPDIEDVSVRFKTPPITCAPGETPVCEIEVFGRVKKSRTVRVRLDGAEQFITLTPLVASVSVALVASSMKPGQTVVEARLLDHDQWDDDTSGDVTQLQCHVQHSAPRVLICSGSDRSGLASALRGQGAFVTEATLGQTLRGHDVLILENLPASLVSDETARSIDKFVRGGGGLLLAGAGSAFGKGGWGGTLLDNLSPLKARPDRHQLHITLLLDRSGSMDRDGRFDAARVAVRSLGRRLSDSDRLEVIAFGVTQEAREFKGGDDAGIEAWLRTLTPGGGTDLATAIDRALDVKSPDEGSPQRMLMILTDWEDSGALVAERIEGWTAQAQAAREPVSIFWFDRDESRRARLASLTTGTRGHLIDVDDFSALLDPMIEVAEESLVLEPATVVSLNGVSGSLARLLRTAQDDGTQVMAQHDAGTAALAKWHVGDGQVGAIPADLIPANLQVLFGSNRALMGLLSSLSIDGGRLSDSLALEESSGRWRFRVESEGTLSQLSIGTQSHPLRRITPSTWISPWLQTPPDSGTARLVGGGDKLRSVRPFQGADPFDRRHPPGSMGGSAFRQALMNGGGLSENTGIPTLLLILAFLGCATELVARLSRR